MRNCKKVVIIGAGYVGASVAYALTLRGVANEIVLIDADEEKAKGEISDIAHGIPSIGVSNIYQGTFSDCADCDMIIITAGKNRKVGQKRLELVDENVKILKDILSNIMKYYTSGIILMVANPVDVLTCYATKYTGLEDGTVFGTGCILDTSRLVLQLSDYVGLSTDNVQAMVIGEHGDRQLPIWSKASILNMPIQKYCNTVGIPWNSDIKEQMVKSVQIMGTNIIKSKERTHHYF